MKNNQDFTQGKILLPLLRFAVTMFYLSFFHGDLLSQIFARDPDIIAASAQYLKAYAIDCLLTCFVLSVFFNE